MIIDRSFAESFAKEWVDAWNSHDLDLILSHYEDDFEMSSPLIIERSFNDEGRLKGKEAIAPYWKIGLLADPPLKFEIETVFCGSDTVVIQYNSVGRRRVAETFEFGPKGLVNRASASYGEATEQ